MKFNSNGIKLIKDFEGCSLNSYQDLKGLWTIGYGTTGRNIKDGMTWTQEQAEQELEKATECISELVSKFITTELTDNQFSALVCFAYNVGINALSKSNLLKLVNSKHMSLAADEFLKWDKCDGKEIPGLLRRRLAERVLFLS